MCGIAGYIGRHHVTDECVAKALASMKNRGPDHQDSYRVTLDGLHVVLLHSRLSILDLDPRSNQPFRLGHTTLVFNGEIYNYIEIREELEARGIEFHTSSDTEVLLQSYLAFGPDCVDRFEGMWSFAILDEKEKRLMLSRDRFAEKPLHIMRADHGLFFASESKTIEALHGESLQPNHQHLLRYMVNGYKSLHKTRETFFEGVEELPFATNLTITTDLVESEHRYWVPKYEPQDMSRDEAIQRFREALIESVRIRLRADVPLAFCLSGGVDSSAITSIASKVFGYDVAAFSIIDDDERYNELAEMEATVRDLSCRHTKIHTSTNGFFERLRDLIAYHDGPVYTISYYVHSLLSEAISNQGFRVACSGAGADELVTGYYDHFNLYLYEMRHDPDYPRYLNDWKEHVGPLVRNPYLQQPELYFDKPQCRDHIYLKNDVFASYMKKPFLEPFVEETYCDSLLRNRMMNEMFHEGNRAVLHEDDLNSMRYSIENRSPYLDRRVFDAAYSTPSKYLIEDGYGKMLLRMSMEGILNDEIRLRRRKQGFNAPIRSLVDFDDAQTQKLILEDSPIYDIVHRESIKNIMMAEEVPNSLSKFLFYFLNTKLFLEARS